jgi:AcrR family transcriptional regulator
MLLLVAPALDKQPDRRRRRRLETIEEILDVAVETMTEQGVAGLSLGEVARRLGIRPPSLYVYFGSKNELYDAMFARGARMVLDEAIRGHAAVMAGEPAAALDWLLPTAERFVRWAIANPTYAQLLFWRPVPGFVPSAEAYGPAVETVRLLEQLLAELQRMGLLRHDVPAEDMARAWTILMSGVTSQQLSNAPGEAFESGRFTSALPQMVDMFVRYYAPSTPTATRRGSRHARQRRPDR